MISPVRSRAVIDTNANVDHHVYIIAYMIGAHVITDTVATYFAIGEAVPFRVRAASVHALSYLSTTSQVMPDVTTHARPVILACYH